MKHSNPEHEINGQLVKKGDLVGLAGKHGDWKFQSYTFNDNNNSEWITVYGGKHQQFKTVAVNQVQLKQTRKKK